MALIGGARGLRGLGFVALTGTPGTGKSSVGRVLSRRRPVLEVGDLPRSHGGVRGRGSTVTVDLAEVAKNLAKVRPTTPTVVLVGHLSHRLPVSTIIVLRCHPIELARRLKTRRRGAPGAWRANLEAEAMDIVLWQAVWAGPPVREVDTTGRSIRSVAQEVERILEGGAGRRPGSVDWLADPCVTEQLLPRLR